VVGASIGELQMDWEPADFTVGFREVLLTGLLMKLINGIW
jgi:hypothetical protein